MSHDDAPGSRSGRRPSRARRRNRSNRPDRSLLGPRPSTWRRRGSLPSRPTSHDLHSIHHLAPELFDGYDGSEENGYLATPEKALFDTVYLRAPRGGQVLLPELELPGEFRVERLANWVSLVTRPRLRTIVSRNLARALSGAARNGSFEPESRNLSRMHKRPAGSRCGLRHPGRDRGPRGRNVCQVTVKLACMPCL